MALRAGLPHGALLLASPAEVLLRLGELLFTVNFWAAVGRSTGGILGGFLISCALAVALAALAARFPRVGELLFPLTAAVKTMPVVSFIILALLWLDKAQLAPFIAGLMVFPPVYLNVGEGIARTDLRLLEMARVFQIPLSRRLRDIYLPQILPYFRAAVSLGLGVCWKAGVAAEVLGQPQGTLGQRLYEAKVYFETPDLFAWTLCVVGLSLLFERLALRVLDAAVERLGC